MRELVGDEWLSLPETTTLPMDLSVAVTSPDPVPVDTLTAGQAQDLHDQMSESAAMVDRRLDACLRLASSLGLPPPRRASTSSVP